MNNKSKNRVFGNELKYVREVLETDFRSSQSSIMMNRLERAFAERFGVDFAISHVNGTATLHTLLEAAGIRKGDEVIVPPLTMSATAFSVLQSNATPVFADVDSDSFQITAENIAKQITPKTKAIITVALYGLSPDMDPIMDLAHKNKLFVIEDNAQCFLGEYKKRLAGTIGDAASFSFQSSKHMTSGEGGMVITNHSDIAEKVRKVQSLGYAGVGAKKGKISKLDIQDPDYERHVTLGWNYRMPELCAAVALAQLENLETLVERRIQSASLFEQALEGCEWLVPQKYDQNYKHAYWTYPLKIVNDKISWHDFRNRFVEMGGDGIYAPWKLTYLEPMFLTGNFLGREEFISEARLKSYRPGLCPVAESLQPRILQFKTNYWDQSKAQEQAEVLAKTIRSY